MELTKEEIAILFVQLNDKLRDSVFNYLTQEEKELIIKYMNNLKIIDKKRAIDVLKKFLDILDSNKYIINTKEIKLYSKISKFEYKMFKFLQHLDSVHIYELLRNEHPQTISIVLSYLDSDKVVDILSKFDNYIKTKILIRLSSLENVEEKYIDTIEKVLLEETKQNNFSKSGLNFVSDVLEKLEDDEIKENLLNIDNRLRNKLNLFSFEDIKTLDSKFILDILKNFNKQELLYALKDSDEEIINKFLECMPYYKSKIFLEELKLLKENTIKSEVAKNKILKFIKKGNSDYRRV